MIPLWLRKGVIQGYGLSYYIIFSLSLEYGMVSSGSEFVQTVSTRGISHNIIPRCHSFFFVFHFISGGIMLWMMYHKFIIDICVVASGELLPSHLCLCMYILTSVSSN